MTKTRLRWLIVAITAGSFALRVWQLHAIPPGWRDDELINSLVISQKIIDGNWAVYYLDASGHEALYHALNAFMLWIFGPNFVGIRLLSAFLGTLTIPALFVLGKRLFGWQVGLLAAAGLGASFWGVMYARFGLRHILMPLLVTLAFTAFWQGFQQLEIRGWKFAALVNLRSPIFNLYLAAFFAGLGFYTYFASRGVPLILVAFMVFVWLVDSGQAKKQWRGWVVMLVLAALLALPLVWTLAHLPQADARVAELAVPISAARQGDWRPLLNFTKTTLSMFHASGDDEWLYNIPGRPVFGPIGAIFFWLGVVIVLWQTGTGLWTAVFNKDAASFNNGRFAYPFLLIWWLAGISPGFISVPPASLGHTIVAQPAVFILAALPIGSLAIRDWRLSRISNLQFPISWGLALILLVSIASRDWPAYFDEWPQRGMVRFLYRADVHEVAEYVNANPELVDFGITGLLAGPWDRVAFSLDATAVSPRWYNPQRALLIRPSTSFMGYPQTEMAYADAFQPTGVAVGGYTLAEVTRTLPNDEQVCFVNGLCWVTAVYHPDSDILELGWEVGRPLTLPPMPLISNPPPPNVYNGPRLAVFAQLLDADGRFLLGDDGLWVDPQTLQPGDQFLQQHHLADSGHTIAFGLYDPLTGERILTEDGRDALKLEIGD
ncbi:MAG: hypothetical protein Kow0080_26680 [Candidatus Promineifilaceae bacterium]